MTIEAGGLPPEFDGLRTVNTENVDVDDGNHNQSIHQHVELADKEQRIKELRKIFIANGDPIPVNLQTRPIPDSAEIEDWRFRTGLDKIAFKLNQEARKGTIGLDEIIEAGRIIALVMGDDTFEERLATIPEIMDRLKPGTYIFPITMMHGYADIRDEATVEAERMPFEVPVYPRVGRVTVDPDGQPAIIPSVGKRLDSHGVTRAEIYLNAIVDLGDHTECEVKLDLSSGTPKNINVDRTTIMSELRKHMRRVLSDDNQEALDIQSLADSFGLLGITEIKDKLHHDAQEVALRQFDQLLSGGYFADKEVRAARYLMRYAREFMDERYDQYAQDYAETGALFGDSGNNRIAKLFLEAYTRAAEWIANGMDRITPMEQYDDPVPYPGLFRTEALQQFLERGLLLAKEELAVNSNAVQPERTTTDVHLPGIDENKL